MNLYWSSLQKLRDPEPHGHCQKALWPHIFSPYMFPVRPEGTAMAKDKQHPLGWICWVEREVLWFTQIQKRASSPPPGEDFYSPVSEYLWLRSAAALEPSCLHRLTLEHPSRLRVVFFIHASKRTRNSKRTLVYTKHLYSLCTYSARWM